MEMMEITINYILFSYLFYHLSFFICNLQFIPLQQLFVIFKTKIILFLYFHILLMYLCCYFYISNHYYYFYKHHAIDIESFMWVGPAKAYNGPMSSFIGCS